MMIMEDARMIVALITNRDGRDYRVGVNCESIVAYEEDDSLWFEISKRNTGGTLEVWRRVSGIDVTVEYDLTGKL